MDEFEFDFLENFRPRDLKFFSLPIYEHFHRKPYHAFSITGHWDGVRMAEKLEANLIRSDAYLQTEQNATRRTEVRRLLFQLEGNVFCSLEREELTVFAPSAKRARQIAEDLAATCEMEKESPAPAFFILSISGGISSRRVELGTSASFDEGEIALHYGSDAVAFEKQLGARLESESGGTSVFRGEPGTGKTWFIRHLIARFHQSHRFYYLPISGYRYLASPDMVAFWIREAELAPEAKRVVVLEDAEDLLMRRGPDNAQKVSSLLNVADGLLGEFLRVHLICTVNCAIDKLDPAITRPGRLVAYREFRKLNREQAQRLADAKGITLPEQSDYSLAEIYRHPVIGQVPALRQGLGFAG